MRRAQRGAGVWPFSLKRNTTVRWSMSRSWLRKASPFRRSRGEVTGTRSRSGERSKNGRGEHVAFLVRVGRLVLVVLRLCVVACVVEGQGFGRGRRVLERTTGKQTVFENGLGEGRWKKRVRMYKNKLTTECKACYGWKMPTKKKGRKTLTVYPTARALSVLGTGTPGLNQALECWADLIARASVENSKRFRSEEWQYLADCANG